MSKGLRWFLLAFTFLIIFDYVVISYWRDNTNIDISASTLMIMLIGLPFAILLGLYTIIILAKYIKNKLTSTTTLPPIEENNTPNDQEDNTSIDLDENILLPTQYLHILETAVITPFGNDVKQIIVELQKMKPAEPDPILKYEKTYPYLSQRIPSMPVLNDDEKILFKQETSALSLVPYPLFTDRAKRLEQITIQLFEKISLVLQSLDIKQLYPEQDENIKSKNQARLHPDWLSQTSKQPLQESTEIAYHRPRPNLQVVYILPHHISDVEKKILSELPKQCLKLLDINEQHDVQYHIHYVNSSDETQMVIDKTLTKHLNHVENPQLLLIIGVDSWIDQLLLNIKFDKEKESVQPAECGFAVLFSDQKITTGINPIASITKPLKYKCYQSNIVADQKIAKNIIRSVEQIQQAYEFNIDNKILESDQLLIVDHKPTQMHALIDLNSLSNYFEIESNQILSTGHLLNDTNSMISGISFSIAIGNTIEKQKNTLLINNAGTQLGTSWMVIPPIFPIDEPDTTLGSSK